MKQYTRWLLRLIGPALLLYFLLTTDLRQIGAILSDLSPAPLLLSMALYPAFVAVKSWRWNLIMAELGIEAPPLGFTMRLYMIGLFLGGATPGQSGDFIKAWYVRERGQPLAPTLFSILLDRLFDFVIMALLALLGLVVFLDVFPPEARVPVQAATIAFAATILIMTPTLMARRPREWLMTRALPLLPHKVRTIIDRWRTQFTQLSLRPTLLANLLLASALSATATMLRIYLLFLALELVRTPILAVIASTALISILQTLPISFAGVGVRDAVLIPMLEVYQYSPAQALSLSALFLLLNIEHIIVGFLLSLRYPLGQTPPPDALE